MVAQKEPVSFSIATLNEQDRYAFENFDSHPAAANVAVGVVALLYGITPATVWKKVKAKEMPAPRKFGPQTTRWSVGELREDMASKARAA